MTEELILAGWIKFRATTPRETIDEVVELLELKPKHFRLIAHENGETTLDLDEAHNYASHVSDKTFTELQGKYNQWIRNGFVVLYYILEPDYTWEKEDTPELTIAVRA